ncbi:MAG: hypothetical protein M3072_11740 [Candidatus Dormibacteraeota bacterium]|nr:hypothetical protein [Candidatus Dormibacteraeota bacterium]
MLARAGFEERWQEARRLLGDQQIGKRAAARRLKVGAGTLDRLLVAAEEARVTSVQGVPKTLPR